MTPQQYYFPYLFKLDAFNGQLHPFQLSASVRYDQETGMPDQLLIGSITMEEIFLSIPFGATLMLQEDKLAYWETDTNLVNIVELSLVGLTADPWLLNTKIDLAALQIGKNEFRTYLDSSYLVTYSRKDSLTYSKASYEKFCIVIIEKEQVNIIPFDWFNKSNSQYDYTWPVTARIDLAGGKLYGQGMRMPAFCIDLDRTWL
jgi:hypothetical protein